ncbi:MAG: NAD-dependent epimerase/dehydratase family protein, partial [Gemmatimonadetes bacterium]|nr:NAD-dependent epimerase/dehydratase family protein [Gemmatimonadota bacterium]
MKVLISGASGLIGSALSARLQIDRNEVVRLVRYPPQGEGEVFWNPMSGSIDAIGMEGMDAVVHLAGENIAGGRWTEKRKQRFRESRVGGTQLLCSALAQLAVPPRVLVCASAIGYYGHCGDRLLNEEDGAGEGFLAGLVRDWEGATEVLAEKRIR